MSTITSANASFSLGVASLFPVAQKLQGWSADDAFTVEGVNLAETQMGVDGVFVGGLVFEQYKMDLMFLASSSSPQLFWSWSQYEKAIVDKVYAFGSISLPSIGMKFVLSNGVLKNLPPMPPAKKVLQPVRAQIEWGTIISAPIA
ncbi:phage tail fiber protein [Rhodanobacter hydrolyticus]|uniref:Uncharacterized protein n=1 Tax=Rhodanobacter hydrolyticus TaxID=2250595 RepID=A0ABW8J5R3_9GAMM